MKKYFERDYARIPDAPLMTVEVKDPASGLEGYVCIHSMGRFGGASGGLRCVPDVSRKEIELLAKAMTYKYSFWNIEQGGAKAGIVVPYDCAAERKGELVQRMATHLEPLIRSGIWSPWGDMFFYAQDLVTFYAGIDIDYTPAEIDSSRRTAVSAFASLRATIEHLGLPPSRARIAIEGFGNVAMCLAEHIKECGAKIVAVSNHEGCVVNESGLDIDLLIQHRHADAVGWIHGAGPWQTAPRERLFDVTCDVLVPGARVHTIDETTAARLNAKALVPIANVPCTDAALAVLDRRGIPYVPDYVVNGGGVCGHILGVNMSREEVKAFSDKFVQMVARMLKMSEARGIPARVLADQIAHQNYGAIAKGAYDHDGRFTHLIHELQKRYLLPGDPVKKFLKRRIRRTFALLESAFR